MQRIWIREVASEATVGIRDVEWWLETPRTAKSSPKVVRKAQLTDIDVTTCRTLLCPSGNPLKKRQRSTQYIALRPRSPILSC